jgi:ATP-dependent exoDNAse (exonuclease V) alpha subunit
VAASAYISGSQHQDARTGEIHDYHQKDKVLCSRVLAPEGSPPWALSPASLWNNVEAFEDSLAEERFAANFKNPEKNARSLAARKHFIQTAQTAQTVMGAIPLELTKDQAEACVENFLSSRFVFRGLVVHYAIHWNTGNPHFHALVTRRALIDGRFASQKDRDIVSRPEHNLTRKHWEEIANKHLRQAGQEARIDCRSNADRASLFEATLHEGYWAQNLADKGETSRLVTHNDAVRQRNMEILCNHPEALIQELANKRTTFTKQHLIDEIMRRVGGDEVLFGILRARVLGHVSQVQGTGSDPREVTNIFVDALLQNAEFTALIGETLSGEKAFTSVSYQAQEEHLTQLGDQLARRTSKELRQDQIQEALLQNAIQRGFELSDEQKEAANALCTGPDIRLLNGRAGTGKTTLLKVVADAYKAAGYTVRGTSFQGKAVEIMAREIGIPCKTLHSLKLSWERYDTQKALLDQGNLWGRSHLYAMQKLKELEASRLTSKDVVIVDEANMISGSLWEPFLKEAVSQGAKVLIVQDTAQIKSREPGDYGRLFADRFGSSLTQEVMRQKKDWQKDCSALLNDGRILDGLKPYQDKGHMVWCEHAAEARKTLVERYLENCILSQNIIALAYRTRDVEALNQDIRKGLGKRGALGKSFKVEGNVFAIGDRVRFTQNDPRGRFVQNTHQSWLKALKERIRPQERVGVQNGTFGTVLSQSLLGDVKVRLDDGRCVRFNPNTYSHLTHGYALGIHQSEGSTFDHTFVLLDPLLDKSTLLVAMTRHREDVQAFASREELVDFKGLVERTSRGDSKVILQDYQVTNVQKPSLNRIQAYRNLTLGISQIREEIEGGKFSGVLSRHPAYPAYQANLNQKTLLAKEILSDWDAHLPFIRLAGMRRDVLEVAAGVRPRVLSDLEHRASLQVQSYREVSREARHLWSQIAETHPPVLVSSHRLYPDYLKLRTERNSLAALFQEAPSLYRPFFRSTPDGNGVWRDFWGHETKPQDRIHQAAISQQAAVHLKEQTHRAFEERLLDTEKPFYETVKRYQEALQKAASLYHLLKTPQEVSLPRATLQGFFQEACSTRDRAAFDIVSHLDAHKPFYEELRLSQEKLLQHGSRGQIRVQIGAYLGSQDIEARALQAKSFLEVFENGSLRSLCQQEGLEKARLTFDVALGELSKTQKLPSLSPDALFGIIKSGGVQAGGDSLEAGRGGKKSVP